MRVKLLFNNPANYFSLGVCWERGSLLSVGLIVVEIVLIIKPSNPKP